MLTKKKKMRKIGFSLVSAALILVLLGSVVVYGAVTLVSFNLVVFLFVFPADSLLQALLIVFGALLLSFGLMFIVLSKRFF